MSRQQFLPVSGRDFSWFASVVPAIARGRVSSFNRSSVKRLLICFALCLVTGTGWAENDSSRPTAISAPDPYVGTSPAQLEPSFAILSEQPLGEIAVLKPEEWNGVWIRDGGEAYRLFVLDAEKGVLAGSDACDSSVPATLLQLRQFGHWYTVATPQRGNTTVGKAALYEINRLTFRTGGTLFKYDLDGERIRTLVKQGALPGRIVNGDVILGTLTTEHHRVLLPTTGNAQESPPVLWKPVGISLRFSEGLNPCKAGEPEATGHADRVTDVTTDAQPTFTEARALLGWCQREGASSLETRIARGFCTVYLTAIADVMTNDSISDFRACLPPFAVPRAVLPRIFSDFLRTNPELSGYTAFSVAAKALSDAFPCRR